MFEPLYCLCAENEGCPRRDTCLRAAKRQPGIYTVTLFWKDGECLGDSYIPLKGHTKEQLRREGVV